MSSDPDEVDQTKNSDSSNNQEKDNKKISKLSTVKYRLPDTDCLRANSKYLPSIFVSILLLTFLLLYAPILLEEPGSITPEAETHAVSVSIGEGGHAGEVYQLQEPNDMPSYQERFIAKCNPEGDYLSTGGSFNCDYRAINSEDDTELVQFDRDFLNRLEGEPLIIAKWERLSPEGETSYVTHRYGYSSDPTLGQIFEAYTPSEPGAYEFSLLINTALNPVGPEYPEENVVYTDTSTVYVYSEEQASSFTISEASYRLERIAIIGIAIGLIQLIWSTYPGRKD